MANFGNQLTLNALHEYWKHSPDMMFVKTIDGVYMSVSQPFADAVGVADASDCIGKTDYELFDDHALAQRYIDDDARLLDGGVPLQNFIEPYNKLLSKPRYCLTSKYILYDDDGKAAGIFGVSRDITQEYLARLSYENELQSLFELPLDTYFAVLIDVAAWRIIDSRYRDKSDCVMPQFTTVDEYVEYAVDSVVDDEALRTLFADITQGYLEQQFQSGCRSRTFEYQRRMPDGSARWVQEDCRLLRDPVNGNLSLIILLRDVDASKRRYTELLMAAERDAMTGLLNRSAMVKEMESFLSSKGLAQTHALFMIDLDNFKLINDSFGHQYGDSILRDVSTAINNTFRTDDFIGRMGGDEFMVLMKNVQSEKPVRRKARELLSALQFTANSNKKEIELTCSVGITVFVAGERDIDSLYHEADMALYRAKRSGKNCYSVSNSDEPESIDDELPSVIESVDTIQLQTLLEYMDGGVVLSEVSDDIRITYVSPSLYRALGHRQSEVPASMQGVFDNVHVDDQSGLRAALFEAAQSNECLNYSYREVYGERIEWRRIRSKSIPDRGDNVCRIVSVITDVTDLKHINDHLRETEVRYRTAIEQTNAMLWEVHIPSRTLALSGTAWSELGFDERIFPDAPKSYLAKGLMDNDSCEAFKIMFHDLYAGRESNDYYFKTRNAHQEEIWLLAHYKLLYDDAHRPVNALGVTVPVPNINIEMHRFEQELHFYEIVKDALLGYVRINLTENRLEYAHVNGDDRYDAISGISFDDYHAIVCERFLDKKDVARFAEQTSRECLLDLFRQAESWKFVDYRRMDADGTSYWTTVFIKLMRHPISGDVYAFSYLRNNAIRRKWEVALNMQFARSTTLLLYSQESMRTLGRYVLSVTPGNELAAAAVIELAGLDRIREEIGITEANDLLFTFGRLCRISISGNVIIGQIAENQVVMLRVDAGDARSQRERISQAIVRLKALLVQAHPEADVNLVSGFTVEKVNTTTYDQLVRKAALACQSAALALGESIVAYTETGIESPEHDDVGSLLERYEALELKYQQQANLLHASENDELTGLPGRTAFYRRAHEMLDFDPITPRVIVRFDINRFKVFNDVRGIPAGDALLRGIATQLAQFSSPDIICGRLNSDHFVLLAPDNADAILRSVEKLRIWLEANSPDFRISCAVGVYRITDPRIDISLMCDRALLALRTAKSGFETKLVYYSESLRAHLLEEQRLMNDIAQAFELEQFVIYFQPQINYDEGTLIGAEALVRWEHPVRGLLSPNAFIPVFEKNGLITQLDEYVWERSCRYICKWQACYPDAKLPHISVNVSRIDFYDSLLCDKLEKLIKKYGLSPSVLHLEITESAYADNPQQLIDTVHALRTLGFVLEMDDFGSGYSSLNTLKEVDMDVLKLDMKFLSEGINRERGGNILSSVIRMAHWLKTPIIAEGVETKVQADYLKSLNCIYMQGYYFAKPMPATEFETLLESTVFGRTDRFGGTDLTGIAAFWDASTQTTLLFNSYVGGAAIIEYEHGNVSIIRANDRFYAELGATRDNYLSEQQTTLDRFDEKNRMLYLSMLNEAIRTGDEAECDLQDLPLNENSSSFWTHTRVRLLAQNGDTYLFYLSIENITVRKNLEQERNAENERNRLLMASTGTSFFTYESANDTLTYQTYQCESGYREIVIPSYTKFLATDNNVEPAYRDNLQSILKTDPGSAPTGEIEYRAKLFGNDTRWYRTRYTQVTSYNGVLLRVVGQTDDIQNVKEREAFSEALSARLSIKDYGYLFNDIIVNQVFNLFYESSDIVSAIETTLALLGEHFDLSRAYIFEDSSDRTIMSNTFEWCATGVEPQIDFLKAVSYEEIGGRDAYIANFETTDTYYCANVQQLSPEQRAILEPQGICSMLQYAIRSDGEYLGMIGFDECREPRKWTDVQVGTMLFVSRVIASFLMRLRQSTSAAFSADFRAALDDNAAFVYIINPDTREIIYSNKSLTERYGNSLLGKHCYEAFVGHDYICEQCPVNDLFTSSGPHIAEVQRRDGMLVLASASPLRWNGRNMVMLSCVDITENKRAERALITEKKKTDLALSATSLTLWTYDFKSGDFIAPTPRGSVRFPWTDDPVSGGYKTVINSGMVMPESVDDYTNLHERVRNGEATVTGIIHFNPQLAPAEWLKITYSAIADDFEKPSSAIAIAQDITAQKLAEKRYQQESEYRKTLDANCLLTMRINVTRDTIEDVQVIEALSSFFRLGMSREDIMPHLMRFIASAEERTRFLTFFSTANLLESFANGKKELSDNLLTTRIDNGSARYLKFEVRLASHPDSGDVIAFVVVIDQTERMLVRQIMDKIIDADYDYVAYIDVQSKHFHLYATHLDDQSSLPLSGDDIEAAAALKLKTAVESNDLQRMIEQNKLSYVLSQLETQETYTCTYRSTPETGGRIRQLVYRSINSENMQLMLTRQDITELVDESRRHNELLSVALTEVREANAAKTAFLAQVGHDIRMPLNAIIGLTTLALGETNMPENIGEYLRMIDSSSRLLQDLIGNILDLSRIDKRVIELHPERYAFQTFKNTIKAAFMPLCDAKDITFHYDAATADLAVYVDKVRFNQIFFNIMSNAVQYTPTGGVIRYSEENTTTHNGIFACDYVIRDTGCGMSKEFLSRLFEPLEREKRYASATPSGKGLGLSIAKSIIDLMGGTIDIKSELGAGTEVRVHLELAIDSTSTDDGSAAKHALPKYDSLAGINILLAEDIPINMTIVTKMLTRAGATVLAAENGEIALKQFKQSKPGSIDLILMDIYMPVMDGLEAARRIRALDRSDADTVPIIALSANAFTDDSALSKKAGINEHLSKPIDSARMFELITKLLK